jgi:hypothetical protein
MKYTKKQKHQQKFIRYQSDWLYYLEKTIDQGNTTFTKFAKDETQIPCLLIMNFIHRVKEELDEDSYESFKHFAYDILEGHPPKAKPFLEVIK